MNTPLLETERLLLRKFTEDDMDALFLILSDEEANRFLPWFPARSMEDAERFFEERYASVYAQPEGYAYAICMKDDHPIGYINAAMAEPHDFGYGLRREFWHKGIATEAGRAGYRTAETGWAAVYHGNARQEQSQKRRCDEESRHALSLFLQGTVAA